MTKRVLVTGGNGWIGSFAIENLIEKGYEVHVVSRKKGNTENTKWYTTDLFECNDIDYMMKTIKPTHLLHFAWEAVPGQCWKSTNNYLWVQSSLELIRSFALYGGQRVVMAGTCAEYDWNYGYLSEDVTPCSNKTPYSASKNAMRQLLSSFSETVGISSAWGRIFFVYGPREHPARLVSSVIGSLLKGKEALCTDGYQYRDFLHVADVGNAFVSLLESDIQGTVNIASGHSVQVRDIVLRISEKLGKTDLIRFGTIPFTENEPLFIGAATERLKKEVAWSPKYNLDSGLENTIAWWKQNY